MKTRHKRLVLIGVGLAGLSLAVALVVNAFRENLVFFLSPTEVAQGAPQTQGKFRVGGLVEAGSVKRDGLKVSFVVTDMKERLTIQYEGILPDLFREGQGIVAQGRLVAPTQFVASEVLAKHDENYMPPEVAKSLQANGQIYGPNHIPAKPAAHLVPDKSAVPSKP